jgi:hypothetical protein
MREKISKLEATKICMTEGYEKVINEYKDLLMIWSDKAFLRQERLDRVLKFDPVLINLRHLRLFEMQPAGKVAPSTHSFPST